MTIFEFKIHFFNTLSKVYPKEEIQSFFNLMTEAYLNMSRSELALAGNADFPEDKLTIFNDGLKKLEQFNPIQYILGECWFYDFKIKVTEATLIPRPETEELVSWVLDCTDKNSSLRVLDIGTGSGCIAIALAKNLPNAKVFALDSSAGALAVAQGNARDHEVDISFINHDLFLENQLPKNLDIIISNPPYVMHSEKESLRPNVLNYEPHAALFVEDSDALIFYKRIANLAPNLLKQNGNIYVEINQAKGMETKELFEKNGFRVSLRKDIFNVDRMLRAVFEFSK